MTNKTPLEMDDLDARSHDIDDAKADEVSGGFFNQKLFGKKTASSAAQGKAPKAFGKSPKMGPKPPQ